MQSRTTSTCRLSSWLGADLRAKVDNVISRAPICFWEFSAGEDIFPPSIFESTVGNPTFHQALPRGKVADPQIAGLPQGADQTQTCDNAALRRGRPSAKDPNNTNKKGPPVGGQRESKTKLEPRSSKAKPRPLGNCPRSLEPHAKPLLIYICIYIYMYIYIYTMNLCSLLGPMGPVGFLGHMGSLGPMGF